MALLKRETLRSDQKQRKIKQMETTLRQNEPAAEATMKAVILYDDFVIAAKVNALLRSAAGRHDETAHWTVRPWRLDLLTLSSTADEAWADVLDAHLIVLAAHEPELLTAGLMDWLEAWAGHRQIQAAAVAVFGGANTRPLSAQTVPQLSRFAERHGLSFIFDAGAEVPDGPTPYAHDLHERAMAMTPTMMELLDGPDHFSPRHWGINE
jgi:hypothetical protein